MNMRRSLVSTLSIAAVAVSGLLAARPAFAGNGPLLPVPVPVPHPIYVGSDLGVTGVQYGVHYKPGPATCNSDGTICSSGGEVPDYGYLDITVKNEGNGETNDLIYLRAVATVDGHETGCVVSSAGLAPGASGVERVRLDQRPPTGTHNAAVQLWKAYSLYDCDDYADGSLLFNQQLDNDPYNDHMTVTIKVGGQI